MSSRQFSGSTTTNPDGFRKAQLEAAASAIAQLRLKLLDTTGRNTLISFKHSERGRGHVRIVDAVPTRIFERLTDGRVLSFRSLPPPEDIPPDERTDRFRAALEAARITDQEYQTAMAALIEEEALSAKAAKIERKLRDRVRATVGLPPRKLPDPMAIRDYARSRGIDPAYDLRDIGRDDDAALQTLLLPDPMDTKLSRIRDAARTAIEETGVNSLYVAFGFLEWYESDASEKALFSPLLLLPVEIDRKLVRSKYQYDLRSVGEDVDINLALSERLAQDFKTRLPPLDETVDPLGYFKKVEEEICADRRGWRVRRFVTVGHFAFARLAMYHDLDPAKWGANGLAGKGMLSELLGGSDRSEGTFAEEYEIDAPEIAAKAPPLIRDADSSQHSAIIDAMEGKNLVIEGPPGTGKSQTITNIIAAAIAKGKRVLFVAEKMAALQVVKSRLDGAGLGLFCLELHSSKARRKDVLESLRYRLDMRHVAAWKEPLATRRRDLKNAQIVLSDYAAAMNAPFGAFGQTVHGVIWGDRQRRDSVRAPDLDALKLDGAETMTESDIDARQAALKEYEAALTEVLGNEDSVASHPWHGISNTQLNPATFDDAIRLVESAAESFAAVGRAAAPLEGLGLAVPATLSAQVELTSAFAGLKVDGTVIGPLFTALQNGLKPTVEAWIESRARYHDSLTPIRQLGYEFHGKALATVVDTLAEKLAAIPQGEPPVTRVNELESWATDLSARATALRSAGDLVSQAALLLGIEGAEAVKVIPFIVKAIDVCALAGERVTTFVVAEMLDRENLEVIERAAAECAQLSARMEELARIYIVNEGTGSADPRRHALALRNTGWFASLSPSTRAAKTYFRGIQRSPAAQKKLEMAAALTELADHIDAVAQFTGNMRYASSLGRRFDGLKTDFARASEVATWATMMRAEFAQPLPVCLAIKKRLASGDGDLLAALAMLANDPRLAALRTIVSSISGEAVQLEHHADALVANAIAIRELDAEVKRLEIPRHHFILDLPKLVKAVEQAKKMRRAAAPPDALREAVGGSLEPDDDIDEIKQTLATAQAVFRLRIAEQDRRILRTLSWEKISGELVPISLRLLTAIEDAFKGWGEVAALFGVEERRFLGKAIGDKSPADVRIRLARACEWSARLGEWIGYLLARGQVERLKLNELLGLHDAGKVPMPLPVAFERMLYRALTRKLAASSHAWLGNVTGLNHTGTRERFQRLDKEIIELQRGEIAAALSEASLPQGVHYGNRSEWTDCALVRHEIQKKKRHIPIRQLLDRAGPAIQAMKPCFMMSPLSLAQFLKPNALRFDLLVVDEASQMRPEDAIGAIARCDQVVVVGDPKQLPPTSFFDRMEAGTEEEDDEEAVGSESILDLSQSIFRPARRLRWHYRSRHGSLVAFSNREFYDDDLIVFPSPNEHTPSQGVALRKLDGLYKSRGNLIEAMAVCRAALRHMKSFPDRSLGIATMNQVQADLIDEEMDRIFATDETAEAYREYFKDGLEPFFVKNLERVQGDERDTILISTVFGPPEPGKRVAQNFGPINGPAGWRRLNVLFTRAKHRVEIFTSMTPEDIVAGPGSPRGAQALKAYLAYAATGRLDGGTDVGREPDSDFELFVCDRIRRAGFEVTLQVGVVGYFIDMAVKDPDVPGTYLLGIECDGATYHSSKSARDRDRLRQEILEGLDWKIYRIWSTDWFRDPAGETRKLVQYIEDLRRTREIPSTSVEPDEDFSPLVAAPEPEPVEPAPPPPQAAAQATLAVFGKEQAREALIRLRDSKILPLHPGADPERCLLRPAMINAFLRFLPEDKDEFLELMPLPLREQTDRAQLKLLPDVFEIIRGIDE